MLRLHPRGAAVALALIALPGAAAAQAPPTKAAPVPAADQPMVTRPKAPKVVPLQSTPAPAPAQKAAPAPKAPGGPALSPALQAALDKANAGDAGPLTKLADGGDVEAQYYAGVMYLFGRGQIQKQPKRGCAYVQQASAKRADAMHLVGMCHQTGAAGAVDKAKAEAAFTRASAMGFGPSKCALGRMLMAEPARAGRGLQLCQEAGKAGEVEAQVAVADAYFSGAGAKKDLAAARRWYEMAAKQKNLHASRRLGQMYANGDGGSKDPKKAMQLWTAAEKAGDPLVAILVADQLFSDMTGGRKPGPGTYGFKNGVPLADIEVVEDWYALAQKRDPRPDVKERAKYALAILDGLKTGGKSAPTTSKTKGKKG